MLMGNAAYHSPPRLNTFSIDGQSRVKRDVPVWRQRGMMREEKERLCRFQSVSHIGPGSGFKLLFINSDSAILAYRKLLERKEGV